MSATEEGRVTFVTDGVERDHLTEDQELRATEAVAVFDYKCKLLDEGHAIEEIDAMKITATATLIPGD